MIFSSSFFCKHPLPLDPFSFVMLSLVYYIIVFFLFFFVLLSLVPLSFQHFVLVFVCWCCVFLFWHIGISYLMSSNPLLLKNMAHIGSFKHFGIVFFCMSRSICYCLCRLRACVDIRDHKLSENIWFDGSLKLGNWNSLCFSISDLIPRRTTRRRSQRKKQTLGVQRNRAFNKFSF